MPGSTSARCGRPRGGARPGRRDLELGHLPPRGREVPRGRRALRPARWASSPTPWTGSARCSARYRRQHDGRGGKLTVRNNAKLRQADRLRACGCRSFLPNDVWAWDDASNNRALISGRVGAGLQPALGLGGGEARQRRRWPRSAGRVPMPAGPEGRFLRLPAVFLRASGASAATRRRPRRCWSSSRSASSGRAADHHLQPATTSRPSRACPTSRSGRPRGRRSAPSFNYPLKPHHQAQALIAFAPAPAEIAVQMYNQALNTKVIARIAQGGETVDQALAWPSASCSNIRARLTRAIDGRRAGGASPSAISAWGGVRCPQTAHWPCPRPRRRAARTCPACSGWRGGGRPSPS